MADCDLQLLQAYHDGELGPADRERVEHHLRQCLDCRGELQQLAETSRLFAEHWFTDLSEQELRRLHDVVNDDVDRPLFRLGGAIGVVAASILIVGFAWLRVLPARAPASTAVVITRPAAWERVATTLRVDPRPLETDSVRFADARLADWMLDGLPNRVQR